MRSFIILGSILAALVGWLFYAAPAHADGGVFSDGTSRVSVHCFAGDNARVVVW